MVWQEEDYPGTPRSCMSVSSHGGPPTPIPLTVQCIMSVSGQIVCELECDKHASVGWVRSNVATSLEIQSTHIKLAKGLRLLANDYVKIHDVMDGWESADKVILVTPVAPPPQDDDPQDDDPHDANLHP